MKSLEDKNESNIRDKMREMDNKIKKETNFKEEELLTYEEQIMSDMIYKIKQDNKINPKQALTPDKMEIMRLEIIRDRFAKNKEEKQALTKQINKIKSK